MVVGTTNFNDGGGFYGDAGGNFGWDRISTPPNGSQSAPTNADSRVSASPQQHHFRIPASNSSRVLHGRTAMP